MLFESGDNTSQCSPQSILTIQRATGLELLAIASRNSFRLQSMKKPRLKQVRLRAGDIKRQRLSPAAPLSKRLDVENLVNSVPSMSLPIGCGTKNGAQHLPHAAFHEGTSRVVSGALHVQGLQPQANSLPRVPHSLAKKGEEV